MKAKYREMRGYSRFLHITLSPLSTIKAQWRRPGGPKYIKRDFVAILFDFEAV